MLDYLKDAAKVGCDRSAGHFFLEVFDALLAAIVIQRTGNGVEDLFWKPEGMTIAVTVYHVFIV